MMAISKRWLLPVAVLAALAVGCSPAATSDPDPSTDASGDLRTDVLEYLDSHPFLGENVRAVVVTIGGDTVLEEYRNSSADDFYNVASVTKSVLATLVGIAIDEGLLSLDAPLHELLPQYASSMSPDVAATTVRALLTMTGPFPDTWSGQGADPEPTADWVRTYLEGARRPPGTYAYSDPGVDVLAAVLARATGVTLLEYGRQKLFDPLGIDTTPAFEPLAVAENIPEYEEAGFAWPVDPQGIHIGSTFIKLRASDLVRLGTLHLQEGTWEGQQIVSADWVRSATAEQVSADQGAADHYGYLWWVHETAGGHDAFLAWGSEGQLLEVVPALEVVAVVQTEFDIRSAPAMHPGELTPLVDGLIVPAAGQLRALHQ